ncbi:MBL fold metallo-hydrolase [Sphingomonas silueang]|uniref:MBL fold metallo-hydrolase n=1 Tax=Sphingomonas silueang TaxID=3156617 RepID=UPI0032B612B0
MKGIARGIAWGLVWLVAIAALAAVIAPRFLDRIYYRGVATDHFDGARFFNPDGEDTAGPPGRGGRAGFLWRQATGGDGRPAWPETVAVRPARPAELPGTTTLPARDPAATPMRVTWIGHASVLVQVPGLNILTDPVWSDRAGPFGFGPRRVAAPGIALADLPKIDLILISHNHYDHLDLATLRAIWARDRPAIVTSLGNDAILRGAGMDATALDWRQAARVGGATVHVVRNHHWGSRWFADRNRALWSAFAVDLPGGNLFFAGDTGLGDGGWVREAAALGPYRLALLPIGAFRFQPGQMASGAHIGPVDALGVFHGLGAARGMAIHWGTFRLSYEGWDTPPRLLRAARACAPEAAGSRFGTAAIGRPVDIPPMRAVAPTGFDRAAVLACLDTPQVRALR